MAGNNLDTIPRDTDYTGTATLWTGAFVTFLAVYFFTFMSFYMQFSTLSPFLASEGLSSALAGFVIGSFTVTSIASRLLSAPLAVRAGALLTARVGLTVIAVGIVFFFIRPGAAFFTLARLLMGAGFGLVSTLLVSLVVRIIPHERLGEGLGYMGLGSTVAMAAGPLAGLEISAALGYRAMFLAMDLMIAVSLLVTMRLPRFLGEKEPPPPPPGSGAPGGLRRMDTRPLLPGSLALFYGAGLTAVTVYLAVYCEEMRLPSAADFFVISTIGTAAARVTTGRIYDRSGPSYVIPPATLLLAASLASILMARSAALLFLAALCYGASAGALFPALQSLAISSVEFARRTYAVAAFFVFYDLGFGLGVVILGYLAGRFGSYSASFAGSLCFIAVLFMGYPLVILRARIIQGRDAGKAAGDGPRNAVPKTPAAKAGCFRAGAPDGTGGGVTGHQREAVTGYSESAEGRAGDCELKHAAIPLALKAADGRCSSGNAAEANRAAAEDTDTGSAPGKTVRAETGRADSTGAISPASKPAPAETDPAGASDAAANPLGEECGHGASAATPPGTPTAKPAAPGLIPPAGGADLERTETAGGARTGPPASARVQLPGKPEGPPG
ncbi:MAG: MFS transporter [Deltaproteobacteria bacterium]|nr:MFS transporter [Deltaproteobacteria bacterium]